MGWARHLGIVGAALALPATMLVAPAWAQAQPAGELRVDSRVVNGRDPGPTEARPLVYVRIGSTLCSGTLVDPTHVVTAAHCAALASGAGRNPAAFAIGWSATGTLPLPTWTGVTRVDVHPGYNPTTFVNDIAVLTLAQSIPGATPMVLATPALSRTALTGGASVRAAGYGYTSAGGQASTRSLVADLTVVPDSACRDTRIPYRIGSIDFTGLAVDVTTAVCAIGVRPATTLIIDTCQGDSGGPLYVDTGSGERLLGLVSVGVGCAGFDERGRELRAKTPGVYTRIAPFLSWLTEVGVRPAPAAPAISARSTDADGIRVDFAPGDATPVVGYRAVASGGGIERQCTTVATTCTINGLQPGAAYTIVGYAVGAQAESLPSAQVAAIAGAPTARPTQPRITGIKTTPGRRTAVTVGRIDSSPWTVTIVVCSLGTQRFRADVAGGKAVLVLPAGGTYRCYAKSSNELGGVRSKSIQVSTQPRVAPRVVNGEPGPSEEFGFLVALGDRSRYAALGMDRAQFCGGTLASPTHVITAAHCVAGTTARDLVVGTFLDGDLASAEGRVVNVRAIKVHPRYRPDTQANDIAVLTLATPLLGVPTMTPVTEEEATSLAAARAPASVAGWGAINQREPWRFTSVYRIGRLLVFPTSACGGGENFTIDGVTFRGYGPGAVDARVMLCAEGVRNSSPVDSCVGDSGGPLIGGAGSTRRLIGIVSWGLDQCATRLGSGVYTRVSAFTRFLVGAGVPFDPDPADAPLPPRMARVTVTSTSVTVAVTPASAGLAPDGYTVSARDPQGRISSCSVAAPPPPATARCTISGLEAAIPYAVSAIAVREGMPSAPSPERKVTPAGLPAKPRIATVQVERGGFAGFIVTHIRSNGSPILDKRVRCSATGHRTRSAPIVAEGFALVSGLDRGTRYSCVALVTNAFGVTKSERARIVAR
jgi:secreted trypsin-like serine protease